MSELCCVQCFGANVGVVQMHIIVKVVRTVGESHASQELQLSLVPRRDWGGRGMLGCHLLQV